MLHRLAGRGSEHETPSQGGDSDLLEEGSVLGPGTIDAARDQTLRRSPGAAVHRCRRSSMTVSAHNVSGNHSWPMRNSSTTGMTRLVFFW